MKTQNEAPTLNYDQAGDLLGICKNTLYSLVSRRQVPHIRLSPRLVRFSKRELEEWLSAHRVVPGAEPQNAPRGSRERAEAARG